MKSVKRFSVNLSKWLSPTLRVILCIGILLITFIITATPPPPVDVRVMKMGLGTGTITSNPAGINCGGDCTETITGPASLTLTATADPGSVFSHWEGDASGTATTVTITASSTTSVRAVFDLTTAIPTLTNFTPAGIQAYLTANPTVNTPARFVSALPAEFRQNWILMSRSESLQTGTAEFPRLLLPNANAQIVFTIGLVTHGSYPGSHPMAIEMMQWDATEKKLPLS
ncbi:InlB B-repeat-containing protein [Paraflavitalea speifideaquila]|uniref:InlB B-repeat-containing protein n=1 Tax=Paraflavitalea speifideaquila TaxID=3076558 RepID=UPI0028EE0415|nr:hypothetical protein [Paraflavitalea speifideiaquila]